MVDRGPEFTAQTPAMRSIGRRIPLAGSACPCLDAHTNGFRADPKASGERPSDLGHAEKEMIGVDQAAVGQAGRALEALVRICVNPC